MGVPIPLACWIYFLVRYRSPAYAVAGACVLAAFYWCALSPRGALRNLATAGRIGGGFWVAAALLLPALGLWQYLHAADIGDLDHTAYANLLWNAGRGRLDAAFQGRSLLGIHAMYTAAAWVPVQLLAGGWGLKLGEALCLVAASLLAWRHARGESRAWLALALLLAPGAASQFFFGFHPEVLGAPLLVLALLAYRDRALGRFLAFTFLLAFTKESLTLAVAGILLLALLERRGWRWVLLPGLLCCAQMAAYWFLIMPRFAPSGNPLGGYLPETLAAIPALWLRLGNLAYAWHVALPFLPLALGYPLRYAVLPLPLLAFYAALPDTMFTAMWPNYAFPLAFLCGAAPLLAEGEPSDPKARDPRLLAACAVTALLCYPLWREIFSLPSRGRETERAAVALNARIPDEASVLANTPCLERFAARREIGLWGERSAQGPRIHPPEHYDYVVLDTAFHPYWLVDDGDLRRGLAALQASPDWVRMEAGGGLFAFRRVGAAR